MPALAELVNLAELMTMFPLTALAEPNQTAGWSSKAVSPYPHPHPYP